MIDADELIELLDGPRGPEVASKLIHTWLNRPAEGVPQEQIKEIVNRWPYKAQLLGLLAQVERLSVLEHQRDRMRSLNPLSDAAAMTKLAASTFQLLTGLRQWLQEQIKDPNARKALGLE